MNNLNTFIIEKLVLNKNLKSYYVENKIDFEVLKYFTKKEIDILINRINNDMAKDIKPVVITNNDKMFSFNLPEYEIYLFYTPDYEKYKNLPYIRFFKDNEGLSVDIYDFEGEWIRSKIFKSDKNLDNCFDFIESKHDQIKNIINNWNEIHK